MAMWQPQRTILERHFRVLRYDMRGHGRSPSPPGPYSIADLAEDVLQLMNTYNVESAHFCGISMGGAIGQWLAVHAPQCVLKLVLCNTAAKIGTSKNWNQRIAQVQAEGMMPIANAVVSRWFTSRYQEQHPQVVEDVRSQVLSCNATGYAAVCGAVRDFDLRDRVAAIVAPTLIVAGDQDQVCPVAEAEFLHEQIHSSRMKVLHAAHLSTVEAAAVFNPLLVDFLLS